LVKHHLSTANAALFNALFWQRTAAAPFSDAELRFRLPQRFGKAAFANSQHNPVQHTLLATSRRRSILVLATLNCVSGCLISLAKPHLPTTNAISFNTRFWQQTIAAPF
jgi:hypothetical protein